MLAIYKREVKSYATSMIGAVFVAFVMLITGIYFFFINLYYGVPYFSYTLYQVLLYVSAAIPLLTMRSFAEERKNKTDQLLFTSPVSVLKIVLAKYLAMLTLWFVPNVLFCLYPLFILRGGGTVYWKIDYAAIGIFFLVGCMYIAIGMFLSSLTESQIIAFVTTLAILVLFYLWSNLVNVLPTGALLCMIGILVLWSLLAFYAYRMTENWLIGAVLEAVGVIACIVIYIVKSSLFDSLLTKIFEQFAVVTALTETFQSSIIDVSGIFLYLAMAVVFICLTVQMIQKRRWS